MRLPAEPAPMSEPLPSSLAAAPAGQALTVQQVSAPAHSPEWASWLSDLGFLPGEAVRVLRRGAERTGNLVVRVGQSTFALRHAEAECIAVTPRAHG
ncbi:ferrous iron transport protein A [Pelomonas aquatica]|uniref:Ferrous iron transport protein A n=2 Tax=Sphaerotilaceae TaxID=2975441 RepID=A0ABU1Z7G5_9BURK|nr:ferrous iron transport protein A [Pelomonas aquatica]